MQQIRGIKKITFTEPIITLDTKEAHRNLRIETDGGDIDIMLITDSLKVQNLNLIKD